MANTKTTKTKETAKKASTKPKAVKKEEVQVIEETPVNKNETIIKAEPIPEEILEIKTDPEEEKQDDGSLSLEDMKEIVEEIKTNKEKIDAVSKEKDGDELRSVISEEIGKMEEIKEKLQKTLTKNKYTTIWNGIDYNL